MQQNLLTDEELQQRFEKLKQNPPSAQEIQQHGELDAQFRILFPEWFTLEAIRKAEILAAQLREAEKLPPAEKYPRLYKLNGMLSVSIGFTKHLDQLYAQFRQGMFSATILNTKVEEAQKELLTILKANQIDLSYEDYVGIVIDSSFHSQEPTIDNRIYHFE